MRSPGVGWAIFAASVLAACGSDSHSPGGDGAAGDDSEPVGGHGGSTTGGTSNGGKGNTAGTDTDPVGAAPSDGGVHEAGGGGSSGKGTMEPPTGPQAIQFDVDSGHQVHAISPLIYGANVPGLDCADAKARFTFCRHRSAAWSTYDWETNASNAGASDCSENNDALSASTVPGAAVTDLIDEAQGAEATVVVTVPMLEYAAADEAGGSAAPACSGDVTKSADYLNTRFVQNRTRKGAALSLTPDTADGYVNQDEFVAFLQNGYPDAGLLYALDTQPELWKGEHPAVRSTALTYAEQVSLSVDYAKMIKDNAPGAEVLGLVGYGYLAAVNQQESPDYNTEGEFYSYFLQQMSDASDADNRRLIDYVDLHWFPEIYPDNERVIGELTSEASVRARVQAPRSLWDPDFVEDSWITQANGGQPIELLTWLQGAIDDSYPGTKLSFSEWAYGGGQHVSGAIAAADALGLYGQQGVELAGVVSFSPGDAPYLIGAFQAFRNYDGQGHAFGDTSVAASSDKPSLGSIYASVDASDPSRMVLVAINRYDFDLDVTLNITHDNDYSQLTPYSISDGHPEPVVGTAIEATGSNSFTFTVPAYSVWTLVPSE